MNIKTLSGSGEVFLGDRSLGATAYTLQIVLDEYNSLTEVTGNIDSDIAEMVFYSQDGEIAHILVLEDGRKIQFFVANLEPCIIRAMNGFLP